MRSNRLVLSRRMKSKILFYQKDEKRNRQDFWNFCKNNGNEIIKMDHGNQKYIGEIGDEKLMDISNTYPKDLRREEGNSCNPKVRSSTRIEINRPYTNKGNETKTIRNEDNSFIQNHSENSDNCSDIGQFDGNDSLDNSDIEEESEKSFDEQSSQVNYDQIGREDNKANRGYDIESRSEKSFGTGITTVNTNHHFDIDTIIQEEDTNSNSKGEVLQERKLSKDFQKYIRLNTFRITDLKNMEDKIEPESMRRFLALKEKYHTRQIALEQSQNQLQWFENQRTVPGSEPIIAQAKSSTSKLQKDVDSTMCEMIELTNKKTNKDFTIYGTKATYDPQILGILTQIQPGTNRRCSIKNLVITESKDIQF